MNPGRFRVAVTDYLTEATAERAVFAKLADVDLLGADTEDQVAGRAADAHGLIVFHNMKLTGASLARLPRCRVVVRCGVGFDNVDLEAAGKLGIVVCKDELYRPLKLGIHAVGHAASPDDCYLALRGLRDVLPCLIAAGVRLAVGANRFQLHSRPSILL